MMVNGVCCCNDEFDLFFLVFLLSSLDMLHMYDHSCRFLCSN